jgi:hypothetical protein
MVSGIRPISSGTLPSRIAFASSSFCVRDCEGCAFWFAWGFILLWTEHRVGVVEKVRLGDPRHRSGCAVLSREVGGLIW